MWLLLDTTGRTDAILCCHINPPTFFLFFYFFVSLFLITRCTNTRNLERGGGESKRA